MKRLLIISSILMFVYSGQVSAQGFYDIDTIQKIEISFSQSNWDYMLDTAKNGSENYIMARWVRINGVQIDSVGVKYKGNSSYDSSNVKNPLHIELNTFVQGQDYQGYSDIKLNNGWLEPSMVRDVLGFKILRNYMHCSKANYAQVYINGTYYGLYPNVEAINKDFVNDYFYSSGNPFFKCSPLIYQLQYFPTLEYLGTDSVSYYNNYEMKSDFGWQSLINLCDTLANNSSDIHKILDVDRALWMLAFNNVLVNLDSYTGVASQNYYLYMDNTERFNTIIWDINMCFGSFNALTGPPGLTITEMQEMSPVVQSTNSERPLIQKLLADPMYKRMYIAHMRTILNEHFANNSYITEAQNMVSIIDTAFQSDPNTFFSYSEFQNAFTQNTTWGPLTIPGIQVLMDARITYLNSTTEFQQVSSVISNIIVPDTANPFTIILITADISDANYAYVGYRHSKDEKFTKVEMFDDGNHDDGATGDGTYGAYFDIDVSNTHYYIYAENSDAGVFSPVRAEHEYYKITAIVNVEIQDDVVINEIMASNDVTQNDEFGEFDDWIELYNNSANNIDLSGYYLTDDENSPIKWAFPDTSINPDSYLIIWADKDEEQGAMHASFKISSSGEAVFLIDTSLTIINEVVFTAQTTDMGYARVPNGLGAFIIQTPTFSFNNDSLNNIVNINQNDKFIIFPNPTTGIITIKGKYIDSIEVSNIHGQIIKTTVVNNETTLINLKNEPKGIYLIKITTDNGVTTVKKVVLE